jgi:hypothetical protein
MIRFLRNNPARNKEPSYFDCAAADIDRMISEASEQFCAGDHTSLSEPVKYNVLWLGFAHVTFGDLDFRMNLFDRDYLRAVALNFEKSVESMTEHNLNITVDLHFIEDDFPLTLYDGEDWFYLDQENVQSVIDRYMDERDYDTVFTTIQTEGEENRARNAFKNGYGTHYAILGLCTAGLSAHVPYSTFNLGRPRFGTFPLEDPKEPSLYATAVAVHEWLHQLEYLGVLLGIEYPNTHSYMGPEMYPGYMKYEADKNDYDFFEFYRQVLSGRVPYSGDKLIRYVGMYPKMWILVKRSTLRLGSFTIQDADGRGYLSGQSGSPSLTLSDAPGRWNIMYSGKGSFVLSPSDMPASRIDLSNACDSEGNTVKLWRNTGYFDAQSWKLTPDSKGNYLIQTVFESGRFIMVPNEGDALLLSGRGRGARKWIIKPAGEQI